MLEKSGLADNAVECLHNEDYDRTYNLQNLNAEGMIFMGDRPQESLNGKWRFCVDLHDTGLRQKWFTIRKEDPEKRLEPYDYDPFMGEEIDVPSCWQMVREKWFYFEGTAWYTREYDFKAGALGERVFLRVGAAQYDTKIFLNHEFVGNHYGGSTPFFADLTDLLKEGENVLMIGVNNARTSDRIPMKNTDWFNYGGIYREIGIVRTPAAFVKDFFIYLKPDSNFRTVVAEVEVEGEADCATLDIPALDVHTAIDLSGGKGRIELDLCPALWSPDKPKLYDVSIGVGADRVNDRVGFREIRVRGTEIFLNGKFIYLLGSNAHEDDEKTGKVTSEADIRRRFAHAKEMNCNYMRLAHYPHHEMASKIADEMGILLWEEIPVYWAIAFDNPDTIRDGRNQMTELVKRDRNRASVIIWSVGNENADTDARLRFMTGLVDICRTLDPTRLVTAACLVNHAELRIVDRLADHLDIIGLNEYYGWYEEDFDELITLGRNSNPDKPVVISETGADGVLLEHAPRHGPFSLEWMARVYRQQTEFLEKLDYVKGFTPWIMYDFRAERRQNDFQRGWNCKGALGRDKKTRKEAFYILQAFYGRMKEKMNGKA